MNKTELKLLYAAFRVGMFTGIREMRMHKLRSFLSLIGVMLGVSALVAMLTIVGGVDDYMKREIGSIAGRVGIHSEDPPTDNNDILAASRSPGFRFKDLDYLESQKEVNKVFRTIGKRQEIPIGKRSVSCRIAGTNKENIEAEKNVIISEGRFFDDEEYNKGLPVCVISWQLAEYLNEQNKEDTPVDPIGKTMVVFNKRFYIIGVFETKSKQFQVWQFRHLIYVPLLAMERYSTGFNSDPGFATFEIKKVDDLNNQIAIVGEKLARHHRSVEDFEFQLFEFINEFIKVLQNVKILFAVIAVASLSVGGLGIMNVMLSSLSERIREIGIRKAIGASSKQIFIQFLTETVTLSLTGGMVGAFIGSLLIIFSEAIYKATGNLIKPQLEPLHMIIVFFVVVFLGVVFGLYPAVKASRLNPVDALRYE